MEHSRNFFWHRLRWSAVARYLPKDRPFALVDVGAGIGLVADFLARDRPQARYQFVEPIESLESHLEQIHGPEANRRGARVFDAEYVVLLDVLEHQPDDGAFIADLSARMQPGARLVITVPALPQLWSNWDAALGHFRRYNKKSLRQSLGQPELEIIETSYLFPEMLPLGVVRRWQRGPGRSAPTDSANFPDLPRLLNDFLVGAGRITVAGRKLWPAGTSMLAVVEKRQLDP
jgi:hypothetical protein